MDFLTPILVACVASSGFWAFLQWMMGRKSSNSVILDEIAKLKQDIDKLSEDMGQDRAINARVRILSFCDELQEGRKHSKDSFDQVMSDVTTYNNYCSTHPHFKNSQTAATVEYIDKIYRERLEKHDFL